MIDIRKSVGLVTLQDIGRPGFRQFGIPKSGYMDGRSAHLANQVVGQDRNATVIELFNASLWFKVHLRLKMAVTGGETEIKINEEIILSHESIKFIQLENGDKVQVRPLGKGLIRYVSFSRSIETTKSFNSTSTYINAKFGGNKGLALVKGDKLLFNSDTETSSQIDTKYVGMIITNHIKIRFMEGPEYRFLDQESRKHFETSSFRVSSNLSRVGYRLIGKTLGIDRKNITSRATSRGSVQVPPSGHPIILMADSPVTGGYPRVAQILSDDVDYLSQMKPGSSIRFLKVDSFEY